MGWLLWSMAATNHDGPWRIHDSSPINFLVTHGSVPMMMGFSLQWFASICTLHACMFMLSSVDHAPRLCDWYFLNFKSSSWKKFHMIQIYPFYCRPPHHSLRIRLVEALSPFLCYQCWIKFLKFRKKLLVKLSFRTFNLYGIFLTKLEIHVQFSGSFCCLAHLFLM